MADTLRDALAAALGANYTLERELTGGGMSRVFVATEAALDRTVVIKVLREEFAADVNRERFRREVTFAAQLSHPHIVPLLTAGQSGDLLWYTMPFVEGESVRDEVRRGKRFSVRDVVRLLHDVLDALAYAHSRGVIHRDIKPGNILRHGNHSLVTDFGVAKALSAARPPGGATSTGMAIGTPAYMAPEQLAADPAADHRVDLYATGLVAYEVLTHVQPFAESSPQATMAAQLTRMPTPIHEERPDIPPALSALIMRLLAKNPAERPQTAMAAIEELDQLTTPTEVVSAGTHGGPSRRSILLVAGVAMLAAVATPILMNVQRANEAEARREELARRADSVRLASAAAAAKAPPTKGGGGGGTRVAGKQADSLARVGTAAARPGAAPAAKVASTTTKTKAAPAPAPPRFSPPRRVAVLPPRIPSNTPDNIVSAMRFIQDSMRKAFVAAGYSVATDGELVELLAANSDRRRASAIGLNIGAMMNLDLIPRGAELQVRSQVVDTWRNQFLSDDETADRTAPLELMSIVRESARMLDRVSWRTVNDAKAVLVFDFDNLTGQDTLDAVAAGMAEHVRATVVKNGMRVVGDSAARMLKDVTERRQTAQRLGAGASIAGSIRGYRRDSIAIMLSVRDHSEETNLPTLEARIPRSAVQEVLPLILARVTQMLNAVNWGPKKPL